MFDEDLNASGLGTIGAGASTPQAGTSTQLTITNAKSISDLTGFGMEAGGSVGQQGGLGIGVEFVGGSSYQGVSFSFSKFNNPIAPAEIHTHVTYTWEKEIEKYEEERVDFMIQSLGYLNRTLNQDIKNEIEEMFGFKIFVD